MGGDLVREARRRAGLTQAELAQKACTTQSAIARLESGRTKPSFDLVQRMLRLCGFRLDVSLDPYDDSDLAQAQALLRLPIEQRLAHMTNSVAAMESLRRKVQAEIHAQ